VNELDEKIWHLADAARDRPEAVAGLFLKHGDFENNALVAVGGWFSEPSGCQYCVP
jgi:hypothetical protein